MLGHLTWGAMLGHLAATFIFGGTLAQLWALEVMLLEARSYVQAMLGILGLC